MAERPRPALLVAGIVIGVAVVVYQFMSRETARPAQQPSEVDRVLAEVLKETPAHSPAPVPAASNATEPEPEKKPVEASPVLPLEEMVSRALPAVVRVETAEGFGSGFFIRTDTLLTNVHVVGTHPSVSVRMGNGTVQPARVETAAPELDIAILRLNVPANGNQPTLPMGSEIALRPGQEVVVLGTPMGLQNTVTRGIVSAVRQLGAVTLVQTDAAVNPGNSGGPVLDRGGRVVGIATMGVKPSVAQGLSFAVAIEHAEALLAGRRGTDPADTPLASLTQSLDGAPASASAQPTDVDALRAQAERTFAGTIEHLAEGANQLETYWSQFVRSCYQGAVTGGFARNWFALFDANAMKGSVAPGCSGQFDYLQSTAKQAREKVMAADETARRAGVYPGARRTILAKYRLDYPGWNR